MPPDMETQCTGTSRSWSCPQAWELTVQGPPPGPAPSPGTLGLFKLVQLGSFPFPPDMFKLGHYKVEKRAVRILLECFLVITVRNISCGKVMFSQASVILSTGWSGGGAVHGKGLV